MIIIINIKALIFSSLKVIFWVFFQKLFFLLGHYKVASFSSEVCKLCLPVATADDPYTKRTVQYFFFEDYF